MPGGYDREGGMKQTVQEAQEPLAQRINPAARLGAPSFPPLAGRVVAIVHPAWHSCGSHQVFASQARAYRSLGAKVISVAIADAPGATEGSNQHKSYMAATADLQADLRLFTACQCEDRFQHRRDDPEACGSGTN